jgi:hypothetical protein
MSTSYDAIPSIHERVIGSDVIAIATLRGPVRVVPIDDTERPRVHGWFEVAIQETLSGSPSSKTVVMRVIGEGTENAVTWPVPAPSDERLLCFLTRDIGPDLPDNLFAPCHNGVYILSADGVARVPEDTLDDATREAAVAGREGLPLEGLRRLIETVGERRAAAIRGVEDNEPAEIRRAARPDLAEHPRSADALVDASLATPGGGRPGDIA